MTTMVGDRSSKLGHPMFHLFLLVHVCSFLPLEVWLNRIVRLHPRVHALLFTSDMGEAAFRQFGLDYWYRQLSTTSSSSLPSSSLSKWWRAYVMKRYEQEYAAVIRNDRLTELIKHFSTGDQHIEVR